MTLENAKENKSNWIASNWFRLAALLLTFSSISFFFYWYSIRPAQIKQACSWVKKHSNAIPARKGMTEDELKTKGMLKNCPPIPDPDNSSGRGVFQGRFDILDCMVENEKIIEKYKPRKYVPAKDWYVKATKEEYTFCLHDKGL
jgi:hypothetical protein